MMKFICTIILFLWTLQFSAQNLEVEKLKFALASETDESVKLSILEKITDIYLDVQTDSLLKYSAKIDEYKDLGNSSSYINILKNEAVALQRKGRLEESENRFKYVLSLLSDGSKDSLKCSALNGYGRLLDILERKEEAFAKYQSAIQLAQKMQDRERQAYIYVNIGNLYYGENNKKAFEYSDMAVELLESLPEPPPQTGSIYLSRSSNYGQIGDMDGVIREALKAIPHLKKSNNHRHIQVAYQNLALAYGFKNDLEKVIYYENEALSLAKSINEPRMTISALTSIAESYRKVQNFDEAARLAKEGVALADSSQMLESLIRLTEILAKSQLGMNDYENASLNYDIVIELQDSLARLRAEQKIEELEVQYMTKEKEQLIQLKDEQLKNRKIINSVIAIIAFLLLLSLYFVWRNLVHRKKVNQQLSEQSEKLKKLDSVKSRFFTNISHELRTPLTLILAPLEEAMKKVKSSSIKSDLQTAHSNGRKLLTLVNEILDLSKLESGEMKIHRSPVNLERLLRRIFFSYHSLGQIRDFILSFSYHLPKDLVVELDVDKFEKVVNNLLSNAFKYSNPGGVITLRASEVESQLKIEVNDTGKGIAPSDIDKIFDRFYQSDDENEPLQGGTGIGLAYAREIAQLFGGQLNVDSILGEGSNFVFTLPLLKSNKSIVPDDEFQELPTEILTTATSTLPDEKPHILIVEDNPEMSRFLSRSLSHLFHCSVAYNGSEALNKIEHQKPDLITSDIMMPNMDGFTFIRNLKSSEKYRKIPTILLTARALEEDKLQGFALGVDDYLTKPFSTKELIARIQNLLRNKNIRETSEDIEPAVIAEQSKGGAVTALSYEEQFLKNARELVLQHLSDNSYKVSDFAVDLNYSTRQLERILKKLTGMSPVEFIREIRLQKAYLYLTEKRFATVAEVRYQVGIENASHFTRKFRERFGLNPGEVMK